MAHKFEFEEFNEKYPAAKEGLIQVQTDLKELGPACVEVAQQLGAEKFTKTIDSFGGVLESSIACFKSVEELTDEVQQQYALINASVN